MKSYSLSQKLEDWISSQLRVHSLSLSNSQKLAQAIQKMADFYIENPSSPTPWEEPWCQQAQIAYYFPLNYLRNLRVFQELTKLNFFSDTLSWFELGTGLGPSLEAFLTTQTTHHSINNQIIESTPSRLNNHHLNNIQLTDIQLHNTKLNNIHLLETSDYARKLCQNRLSTENSKYHIQWMNLIPKTLPQKSLLVMSYSLTEFRTTPEWIWSADSIIIIEPSTREDGRRLMNFRSLALEKGYQIIAPCTHQASCPLLTHSQKDWCHDRLFFNRPQWMLEIEKHLPFKNQTLTFSYLALKKQRDKNNENQLAPTLTAQARVVGDFLDEKGKTRQLICRNSEREFLSFIKKNHKPMEFFRGDLLILDPKIEKKGDELRPSPDFVKQNAFS